MSGLTESNYWFPGLVTDMQTGTHHIIVKEHTSSSKNVLEAIYNALKMYTRDDMSFELNKLKEILSAINQIPESHFIGIAEDLAAQKMKLKVKISIIETNTELQEAYHEQEENRLSGISDDSSESEGELEEERKESGKRKRNTKEDEQITGNIEHRIETLLEALNVLGAADTNIKRDAKREILREIHDLRDTLPETKRKDLILLKYREKRRRGGYDTTGAKYPNMQGAAKAKKKGIRGRFVQSPKTS